MLTTFRPLIMPWDKAFENLSLRFMDSHIKELRLVALWAAGAPLQRNNKGTVLERIKTTFEVIVPLEIQTIEQKDYQLEISMRR